MILTVNITSSKDVPTKGSYRVILRKISLDIDTGLDKLLYFVSTLSYATVRPIDLQYVPDSLHARRENKIAMFVQLVINI